MPWINPNALNEMPKPRKRIVPDERDLPIHVSNLDGEEPLAMTQEERYDYLSGLGRKELFDIANRVGATRRKRLETTVYEILSIEFPDNVDNDGYESETDKADESIPSDPIETVDTPEDTESEPTDMEIRYNELSKLNRKELFEIANSIGATRRKKLEDTIYEILSIEYPHSSDESADESEPTGIDETTSSKPIENPVIREGRVVWAFQVRATEFHVCPKCGATVRGSDKIDRSVKNRDAMSASCDCNDREWRYILQHTVQYKDNGNWKQA